MQPHLRSIFVRTVMATGVDLENSGVSISMFGYVGNWVKYLELFLIVASGIDGAGET